ncbi:hypothetical protein EYC80_005667 [Monilinia laxa]|uniref:DNA2/NAM7 helicase-like C-terminal domain-containing protein n=1 Tax=Monilinia laxa TaxID=61186 RepID=A0A5N6KEW0_MONLA|nr:hypothetical protein EYC80_005667 [Monilinia laxa]
MDITDIRVLPTEDELCSEAVKFLPSTDPDEPHFLVDSAARLLDTHFRFLRHDIFGELKSALGGLIVTIEAQPSVLEDAWLNLKDIRAHSYFKAQVANIIFDHRRGLEARLSFSHPTQLAKKIQGERRKRWEESRLSEGVLLSLLTFNGTKCSPLFLAITKSSTDLESNYNLASHEIEAFIMTEITTHSQQDFESLMLLSSLATEGILIELPSVILATFTPILEKLQYMQCLNLLPFRQWILHNRRGFGDSATMDIPPPLYARGSRFAYSLSSILNDGTGKDLQNQSSSTAVNDAALLDEIERRTELDRGQSEALLAALLREFCHIQGPPGTGKSFLGVKIVKILLAHRAAKCYTNHVLDQFLEHVIQSGVEEITRVGGQSKSDMLAGKSLRVASRGESMTRSESGTLGATCAALKREDKSTEEIRWQLDGLNDYSSWKSVKGYLALQHPRIYRQFSRFDEDGYKTVGGYTMDDLLEMTSFDVYALYGDEKLRIDKFLAEAVRKDLAGELFERSKTTEDFHHTIQNVYSDIDRRVLQTADIIGVTTTGLATNISTLRHVNAKVIICEEAGEVLDNPNSNQIGDRRLLQKKNLSELLRIATVDNFQGEEAKVVIVSLVRSTQEKNVGFLKTTNRNNVLLSRAQHGFYLIGNSETYSSVGMWKHVLGKDCGLCLSRCEVQFGHSQCTLKCYEACAPCIEKRTWAYGHQGGCNIPFLKERDDKSRELERAVKSFCEVRGKYQPATKLHDAVITAVRQRSLEYERQSLSIRKPARTSPRGRRIAFAGAGMMLKIQYITLADNLLIDLCLGENLPKLAVEGTLCYAKIAKLFNSIVHSFASSKSVVKRPQYDVEKAKELLEQAKGLCEKGFQNAALLLAAVEE